ncbi:hypothetical protein KSF_089900 [Reticulibacter mediterranei]|uniref:FAD-binding domain-containing protein n=1 Tax=Reticulibacter mediterranei TaxID=2778369 RepID=A0A8J3N954_9CHLR|nr:FAD-dependent monooxygenase [Reticulibacter mediterranei]GHO98942.1 hypothetical protein KSF_089900 [Reticulibacter mediterranei]
MVKNDLRSEQDQRKQAIVIGAGIAGLLAARVLSEHYGRVLIVERDVFPSHFEVRAGTPQAFHVHRILPRGKMILEHLFPGYRQELLAEGAYEVQHKLATLVKNSQMLQLHPPEQDSSCSRSALEWEIRQRVQMLPRVEFLTNQEVVGLHFSPEKASISGVKLRQRGQVDQITTVRSDLVIDASGRTSKLKQWLQEMGYTLPDEEYVRAHIGYSTRYYKASPELVDQVGTILVDEKADERIPGICVLPIENHTLCVTVYALDGNYPSIDVDEFEQTLKHPHFLSTNIAINLQNAEPLTPPRGYRVPQCIRYHYEQMSSWPAGILPLGDALCHFDPIYGQGMTVAAIEAETLGTALKEQANRPEADFELAVLKKMQDAIAPAWWLSAISDMRGPGVIYEGPGKPQGVKLLHQYIDSYYGYALEHPVAEAQSITSPLPTIAKFFLMNGLILPPAAIFNAPTLALLLEAEAAFGGQQLLHQRVQEYGISPAEILDQVVPQFLFTFVAPAGSNEG